jgi:hypothetical protein
MTEELDLILIADMLRSPSDYLRDAMLEQARLLVAHVNGKTEAHTVKHRCADTELISGQAAPANG